MMRDEALEFGGFLDFGFLDLEKDRADDSRLARQRLEQAVSRRQRLAGELLDVVPARARRQGRRFADQLDALLVHLEEGADRKCARYSPDRRRPGRAATHARNSRPWRRGIRTTPRRYRDAATRASSALAGSSAGSCGTRRPSKEAFKIDCRRRAASPASASRSVSASSAAANASETRRRNPNASEVRGSGKGIRHTLDTLFEAWFVVCPPCSMKKRRPISSAYFEMKSGFTPSQKGRARMTWF